jgi:hypothetical protein
VLHVDADTSAFDTAADMDVEDIAVDLVDTAVKTSPAEPPQPSSSFPDRTNH